NRDINFKGKAITVMSENGPENCIIDCQGRRGKYHRGFYFHSGEGSNSVVDGFTITNGFDKYYSGGIYCRKSSPKIVNCIITRCRTECGGAGIYCKDASPLIAGCLIADNHASGSGGGLEFYRSSAMLTNCMIADNSAGYDGGGIRCDESSPTITDCIIIGNLAKKQNGGGIVCAGRSSPTFSGCIISGNLADKLGGGIYSNDSAPLFSGCTISGNSAGGGGGLHCQQPGSTIKLTNCLISGNSALRDGGGIQCCDPSPIMTNCTIAGNSAGNQAGGLEYSNGTPKITNCVLWNNTPKEIESGRHSKACEPLIIYSNIKGGWQGEGNVDAEPLFIMDGPDKITGTWKQKPIYDPNANRTALTDANASFIPEGLVGWLIQISSAHGKQALITANTAIAVEVVGDLRAYVTKGDHYRLVDYYLQPGSPCIDTGTAEGAPATDIQGRNRNGKPDIGAYETGS
ncbi:MAG: right-handed parallel beta-helix repeat-containing protein, partial [Planctomycetota bacterium]